MAPKNVKLSGIDALCKELTKFTPTDAVYVLFCGSKTADGKSWCPDCVKGMIIKFVVYIL